MASERNSAAWKRGLLRTAIAVVVLAVVAFALRNTIALHAVRAGLERASGFPVMIGGVDLSPSLHRIEVRDVRLLNPPGYPERDFVLIPELTMAYRPASLLRGSPHVAALSLNIDHIIVVKEKGGRSNVGQLKRNIDAGGGTSHFVIDRLHLHLGQVTIKDYSGTAPKVRNLKLDIDASYRDVTDTTDVTRLVLLTVVDQVPALGLDIDTAGMRKGLGQITTSADKALEGTAGSLQQAGKGLFESLQRILPDQGR